NNNTRDVRDYLKPLGYKFILKIGADEVYELNSRRYSMMLKYRVKQFRHYLSSKKAMFKKQISL
ncbi:MAG: hypothetical protein ACOYLO_10985, partial [Ferruginibacter sp.]